MYRASGADAAFLAAETDEWLFHVAAVQILDPTDAADFGFATLYEVCERRIHLVPQLRWKLIEPPFRVGWSWFVDDPDFDLAHHLHHLVLPAPGGSTALAVTVGDLLGRKIDRSRPLWEMWFIEGLDDGRVALFTKMHHSIIDGQSGAEMATLLFDLTPDAVAMPEPPAYRPEATPSWWEVAGRNSLGVMSLPMRAGRFGRQVLEQGVASAPLYLRGEAAMPFQAPPTPFNGQLTSHRSFGVAALPFAELKAVKDELGVKLNDVILAVCAGVLRSYLDDQNELPDRPLIAEVPVSTRTGNSSKAVGTQVASLFVSLATDIAEPLKRLGAISKSAAAAKKLHGTLAEHRALGVTDTLVPSLFSVAARAWSLAHLDARTPPPFNLIISNVAGPQGDFYLGGARIEHMYPLGPLLYGGGLNITLFSNGDTIDVGLLACPELVPDPWDIAERFVPTFDELVGAVETQRRGAR